LNEKRDRIKKKDIEEAVPVKGQPIKGAKGAPAKPDPKAKAKAAEV